MLSITGKSKKAKMFFFFKTKFETLVTVFDGVCGSEQAKLLGMQDPPFV